MTVIFRMRQSMLKVVRHDLQRPHNFAAERVGFLFCRAGKLPKNGIVVLAAGYQAVADEDYVENHHVGAMMGPSAIRKALQAAYNGGAQDIGIFHVHMHEHSGKPGFSGIDLAESKKFVPDFFNAVPAMPHGAIVLSHDRAVGLCWRERKKKMVPVTRFVDIGAPLTGWE